MVPTWYPEEPSVHFTDKNGIIYGAVTQIWPSISSQFAVLQNFNFIASGTQMLPVN